MEERIAMSDMPDDCWKCGTSTLTVDGYPEDDTAEVVVEGVHYYVHVDCVGLDWVHEHLA